MTDEQYIEIIKKKHANRKLSGSLGLLVVVAVATWVYFAFNDLNQRAADMAEVGVFLTEGERVTQVQISGVETLISLAHSTGTENGAFLGQFMAFAGLFAVYFLVQIFGGRKERLLLEYYEKSASNQ
ncbi:hypothetical protein MARLIPOL_18253 [Marinobacter lipolyticus SM19]|uniref:Uncharacterized protein n=1 Tax=Marinobacter lipolyticus SM19 TaxID=1318628 RepID=R8AW37_9GAMM|nr:hypothetical protein [Marinobacter lipolyticus]EON90538.1 hypothetical protein MARLIPOL_18253 [Marinobacter lipolyticus SM19]